MYGESDIENPIDVDPKYTRGPDAQTEEKGVVQSSSAQREPEQVYGGVMPIDSTPRHIVDEVAEDYSSVNLEYDEGIVHITGDEDQIDQFVQDVISADKRYDEEEYSEDDFFDFSAMEALEHFFPGDPTVPVENAGYNTKARSGW